MTRQSVKQQISFIVNPTGNNPIQAISPSYVAQHGHTKHHNPRSGNTEEISEKEEAVWFTNLANSPVLTRLDMQSNKHSSVQAACGGGKRVWLPRAKPWRSQMPLVPRHTLASRERMSASPLSPRVWGSLGNTAEGLRSCLQGGPSLCYLGGQQPLRGSLRYLEPSISYCRQCFRVQAYIQGLLGIAMFMSSAFIQEVPASRAYRAQPFCSQVPLEWVVSKPLPSGRTACRPRGGILTLTEHYPFFRDMHFTLAHLICSF